MLQKLDRALQHFNFLFKVSWFLRLVAVEPQMGLLSLTKPNRRFEVMYYVVDIKKPH